MANIGRARTPAVAAIVLAISALPAGAVPTRAVASPASSESGRGVADAVSPSACWTRVRLPKTARLGRLTDYLTVGGTSWIFGNSPPVRGGRPTALRKSRGGSWRATRVPLVGVSGLVGGDGRRGRATWAVGFRRPGVSMQPIAMRWSGGRWSNVRVPDPPGPGASLVDAEVLRNGSVWAVGTRIQGGSVKPFVTRWKGRWQRKEPRLDIREAGLAAVTSSPGGKVWTVGWQLKNAGPKPLILRRTSSGWRSLDVSGLIDGQAVLTDIEFKSDDLAYASGFEIRPNGVRYVPLLLRWNGNAWDRVPLPWDGDISAVIHGLAVGPGNSLMLVGARVAQNAGRNRAFHARYQRGAWTVRFAPVPRLHNNELTDVEFVDGSPRAVGTTAIQNVLLKGCRTVAPGSLKSTVARSAKRKAAPRPVRTQAAATVKAVRQPRFRDVARARGVYEFVETWGATVADFDSDGWDDIFLGRHNRTTPKLLLGGRKGFTRIARDRFKLRDRHGCTAGDVDADGKIDLYCSVGANRGSNMTSNELWLRPGTRKRRQVTAQWGVVDPFGRGRVATFFHLDDDPYPELYVVNEPERVDGMPGTNRLYINDGGRRFLSAPRQGIDRSMGGSCATAADIDNDGDEDLLTCTSEPWAGMRTGLRVFRNDRGKLVHARKGLGLRPIGDVDVVVADFDGDGRKDDVAQLGRGTLRVSIGSRRGQKKVYQRSVSSGVALAAGDVNADGRADLYVLRGRPGNQPDLLLLNRQRGRRFVSQRIPQARGGVADDVVTLDHDRNGLDDFLVTNGRQSQGPVQLIASYRR